MKRILTGACVMMLAACGVNQKGEEFRKGFPQANDVKVNVPARGQALLGEAQSQQALVGDDSKFYAFTRAITLTCNTATAAVLGLVKAISNNPATTVTATTAVWGPHTDALSPNTYKFTVTKNADNDYSYTLEGKGKNEADSAYKVVLSGSHKVAVDAAGVATDGFGNGTFLIDWDKSALLPEHGTEVGTAEFTYSRLTATADTLININFHQVMDNDTGKKVDATYKYDATPAAGGSFEFQMAKDLDTDPLRNKIENLAIKSRWLQTGAGRSDVTGSGGDLGTVTAQHASECWDENFNSLFLTATWLTPEVVWGSASACTAFGAASYSTLPTLAP
jgi:hypothetical protein